MVDIDAGVADNSVAKTNSQPLTINAEGVGATAKTDSQPLTINAEGVG